MKGAVRSELIYLVKQAYIYTDLKMSRNMNEGNSEI